MRSLWIIVVLLATSAALAQTPLSSPRATAPASSPFAPSGPDTDGTFRAGPQIPHASDADERDAWVVFLRKQGVDSSSKGFDYGAAFSTLIGGLLSAGVTFITLRYNARREDARLSSEADRQRNATRIESQLKYADKLLDFRLKRLELFYSPLYALVQQSTGVYDKVKQLLLKDPGKYRAIPHPRISGRTRLQILWDGEWMDFRWLDQLPSLKADPQTKPLVDEVMRIGEQVTCIISKYGSYAASDTKPAEVYGKYLAHFAIISAIHKDDRTAPYRPGEQEYGYYPEDLNDEIKDGYDKALMDLKPYLQAVASVLQEINPQ